MIENNRPTHKSSSAERRAELGQYFTTHPLLKDAVVSFILNRPATPTPILEPCIGKGDLVSHIREKLGGTVTFDMYEIDDTIDLLDGVNGVTYGDFLVLARDIVKKYDTIVGNPPYVRTRRGNLYIDFVETCYRLLADNGELVFIVPADFLKLTSAAPLLNDMMMNGSFTHIFHPHNEKMFEGASIDVIVFRYCKNRELEKRGGVLYNGILRKITNMNGLITFDTMNSENHQTLFQDRFDIYVGLVTGKEEVFKNEELGTMAVLNGENKVDKYIYIDSFPCDDPQINAHLLQHKAVLMARGIRKFGENNWFEWGALRNLTAIKKHMGRDCIYIHTLTRLPQVAFAGKVQHFGGGLIMLVPKDPGFTSINTIVSYLNSDAFKHNFMFSGRFKIGHRAISNSIIS
jgi:adenine-specific DNA-methyltransferase